MSVPLPERWQQLWQRLAAAGDPDSVFQSLRQAYAQAHRHYHNLAHIAACLRELDETAPAAAVTPSVELALWFHDGIYDPRRKDNEACSAAWATSVLNAAALPAPLIERTGKLILATTHSSQPADPEAALVVDIDLAILGRPADEFDKYAQHIRREYEWVSDEDFRTGRAAILKKLLERSRIYATESFVVKYESAARANLKRSLKALLLRS